nr:MAG TPA: hypothetical protein [Caudoviricetes sp.]
MAKNELHIEVDGISMAIEKAKELNNLLEQAKKLSAEIASQTSLFQVSIK